MKIKSIIMAFAITAFTPTLAWSSAIAAGAIVGGIIDQLENSISTLIDQLDNRVSAHSCPT